MFLRQTYFKAKMLQILDQEFVYGSLIQPSDAKAFDESMELSKKMGGSHYDAAVIFMLNKLGAELKTSGLRTIIEMKIELMPFRRERCQSNAVANFMESELNDLLAE